MNKCKYLLVSLIFFCVFSITTFADEHVKIDTYDFTTQKWSYEYVKDGVTQTSLAVSDNFISPFAIIGTDNRSRVTNTTEYPYSCIGTIYVKTASSDAWKFKGTGFLVSPSLVLTAAHCVYDAAAEITEIRFTPAKNGTTNPYNHAYATKVSMPSDFKKAAEGDYKYDYAVIKLDTSIGNTAGYFSKIGKYSWSDSDVDKFYQINRVNIAGYPKQYSGLMYRESGVAYHRNNQLYFYYKIDTTDGQDGSPIFFTDDNGNKKLVGIHVNNSCKEFPEYNQGRRITDAIEALINAYK